MATLTDLFRLARVSIRRHASFRTPSRARRGAWCRWQPIVATEMLEDRTLLSFLTVTTSADVVQDDDGVLSLREAILIANDDTGGTSFDGSSSSDAADTIQFDTSLANQSIDLLGTQLPTITGDLTITGLGAEQLTIDAQNSSRIFEVATSTAVGISELTLTGGNSSDSGGAIHNSGALVLSDGVLIGNTAEFRGGGIFNANAGTLSVTDSIVENNSTTRAGGGGIANNGGTMMVASSTLRGNSAEFNGGGVWNDGTLTVTNSTLIGNSSNRGAGIFNNETGTLTVAGSTLSENVAEVQGGGLFNRRGIVTVTESTLSGNSATRAGGGGTTNTGGTLTVANSTLSGNSATRFGGGILSQGLGAELIVTNSTLSGNSAGISGGGLSVFFGTGSVTNSTLGGNSAGDNGGGIHNRGVLDVTGSTLTSNTAGINGGGLENDSGTLAITGSTVSGNSAGTDGGGVWNDGMLSLSDSTVSGNSVGNRGAGLYNDETGTLMVAGSTLSENVADFQGGGLFNLRGIVTVTESTLSGNSATRAGGGGIANNGGQMTVANSTLSGNSATRFGGGILSQLSGAELIVTNSTLSGNSAGISGGGLSVFFGTASVTNSTIVLNRADADGDGIGIGGGVHARRFTTLNNTIVAGNVRGALGSETADDLGGVNFDPASAHNLIGDAGSSGGLTNGVNGNLVGNGGVGTIDINTVLDVTLADNGGPTLTHALVADSPAINAGNNALAVDGDGDPLVTDQRGAGFPRIVGSTVDIGAYELQNQAPEVGDFTKVGAEDNVLTFSTADFTTHFTDPDGDPLLAVRIETLPDNGTLELSGTTVSAGQVIAAADLDALVFVPDLNFHGETSFSYTATDGIAGFAVAPALVILNIRSAFEQAADLQAQVDVLVSDGVLNDGQGNSLKSKLDLKGMPNRDAAKIGDFIDQVNAWLNSGILSQEQADDLLAAANTLLISVTTV